MTTGENLLTKAIKHLEEGYKLIFSPSLDTKGCLIFGTIGLGENAPNVVEFVIGEGKVRDLDSSKDLQNIIVPPGRIIAISEKELPGKAYIINLVYRMAKEYVYDLIPCVLEWSYYDHPVGRLTSNEIWWEVRPYT